MVFAELIAFSITVLNIIYFYFKYIIFNFWRKRGVFYVEPIVPIGNFTPIVTGRKQYGVFFNDAYSKYKEHRAFGMYGFFTPILVITDLNLMRTVLLKEFHSFHDRGLYCNEEIDPLTGHLFLISGENWKNMRNKIISIFTSARMKEMFPILKECGDELAMYLESKAQIRDSIEIKDIFARYTTDVIMSTAFGIKSNCIQEPNNEYRNRGKKIFGIHFIKLALMYSAPKIFDLLRIPLTPRSVTNFYSNMFRETVEYRKSHPNIIRKDFVNLLMQLMEKGCVNSKDDKETIDKSSTVNKLTMMEATAQSFVFFAAGFETSASTATFALYELAQHHDIQDKLRNEIDEVLEEHGDLTYGALEDMTYLQNVIDETLRKYPPVPVLNRICTEEIDLPTTNIRVPKGTLIIIPVLGVHRDPSIYPDPDNFDPERFNKDKRKERHRYAHMPFGQGPRNCIGLRFGYLQTKIALVSLLSKYKFQLHLRTPVPLSFNERCLILEAKSGVHLIIEPR
ncbi:probable cytochrome P450 6a14 [Solenopsis invicta]|uniref:probable cytochrome P450 6a14 n=1 Tax=Solenopsis invicta TaxID=13686 RepID=UPI00193D8EEA|nr:probable cytochrome P450 6a14 [Solenopsis invicta]